MITRLEREIQRTTIRFIATAIILLGAAIALSVVWNRSIKDELAIQASSFVRKGIASKEMRGVVEYLNGVQFSAFSHVSLYTPSDEHIITLPPIFDRSKKSTDLIDRILYAHIEIPIFLDTESKNLVARANFSYQRFELVPYAILVWLISAVILFLVFNQAKKKVASEVQNEIRLKEAELTDEITKKVRHNIRSPLASLRAIFIEKMFSPETIFEQGVGVINRLEEIIEELKPENITYSSTTTISQKKIKNKSIYDVTAMVGSIVAEKKLISKKVSIDLTVKSHDSGIYTFIPSSEFRQTLSNIIDNSLQAISDSGIIQIFLTSDESSFSLEIKDTGCGISTENISKVFEKNFTHGKQDGTGLGLYYAKKLVESNSGNIEIDSELGAGTTVAMIIPKAQTPSWHLASISLKQYQGIAICDDQKTMVDAWRVKFDDPKRTLPIQSFASCEIMESKLVFKEKYLYLVDYDLGEKKMNGLDFLRRHPHLSSSYILVTGHFDEAWLQQECELLKCKLLPKDNIFQLAIS